MSEKSHEVPDSTNLHQCPECGLHYADEQMEKKCEAFCSENNACSLDITKHSIEAQKL